MFKTLTLNKDQIDHSFNLLEYSISEIFNKQCSKISYQELHQEVYILVVNRLGEKTYNSIKNFLEKSMKLKYQEFLLNYKSNPNLMHILNCWREVNEMLKLVNSICLYLQKNYIAPSNLKSFFSHGKKIFAEYFFSPKGSLSEDLFSDINILFMKERNSEIVDTTLLSGVTSMIKALGEESFEFYLRFFDSFLQESKIFFQIESEQFFINNPISIYLSRCLSRFNEEKTRIEEHFFPQSQKPLIDLFIDIYIFQKLMNLMENEKGFLKQFIDNEKYDDLKNFYALSTLNNTVFEIFKTQLSDFMSHNLNNLMGQTSNSKRNFINLIENFFIFKEKIQQIIQNSFRMGLSQDKEIIKIIDNCFFTFVNNEVTISNSLNKYIDYFMKKQSQKVNNLECEDLFNKIIDLFKIISNKDLFEIYYKKLLMKRLIIFKNSSHEIELNFINKLTIICGNSYTSSYFSLFTDLKISNQNYEDFQKYCENSKINIFENFQLHIDVISKNKWFFDEFNDEFEFSDEIITYLNIFEKFYKNKHPERNLKWAKPIGTGVLKANFQPKSKILILNNIQIFVLLCFNWKKVCSFQEIQEKLKIQNKKILLQSLKSLIKFRILQKIRNSDNSIVDEKFVESDNFSVNLNFSHRNYEIRVPLKISDEDVESTQQKDLENLALERKILIESYIIRILKAKKTINHEELVEDILKFCSNKHFIPQTKQIKESIESLMNREYMKRALNNSNCYLYIP